MINKGYLQAKTDKASDEVYTPDYAVTPILKYVDNWQQWNMVNPTIWCPFDYDDSEFVIQLRGAGYKVIATHIDTGHNFFEYEPEKYDLIISNPPFSIKDDILRRLYELDKPYAILMPIPALQGQRRFPYMKDCQVLAFDKRINFIKNKQTKEIQKGVSFGTMYLCRKFLPKALIMEELEV